MFYILTAHPKPLLNFAQIIIIVIIVIIISPGTSVAPLCVSDINAKGVIMKAFEQYRLKTCIDYKPWSGEKNYISVFKGSG